MIQIKNQMKKVMNPKIKLSKAKGHQFKRAV
jgi:hypothetical protein